MNESIEWFDHVRAQLSVNAVATRAEISQSALAAQVKKGAISPEYIVRIARALNEDVIEGLMRARFLTREDLGSWGKEATLANVSDRALVDEVWNRIQRGSLDENGEPRSVDIDIATDVVVIE